MLSTGAGVSHFRAHGVEPDLVALARLGEGALFRTTLTRRFGRVLRLPQNSSREAILVEIEPGEQRYLSPNVLLEPVAGSWS